MIEHATVKELQTLALDVIWDCLTIPLATTSDYDGAIRQAYPIRFDMALKVLSTLGVGNHR